MANYISFFLVALNGVLAIPVAILFLEIIAAIVLPQPPDDFLPIRKKESRHRVAVLVPAHNESSNLLSTLADIKAQLHAGDRLLVVADNCSDDTAAVATAAGAEVIERHDPNRFGKGYALDWGIRHLGMDPPEIVIMFDADCRLGPSAIDRLAATCIMTRGPAQAFSLMIPPEGASPNLRISEFAWRVKNWVRPFGLRALGLPCPLFGSGMAFPWNLIHSVNLASGHIVEDLKLGLDFALTGFAPVFCPSARVVSYFPFSISGIESQRLRWEQGHINMIPTYAPRLFLAALYQFSVIRTRAPIGAIRWT